MDTRTAIAGALGALLVVGIAVAEQVEAQEIRDTAAQDRSVGSIVADQDATYRASHVCWDIGSGSRCMSGRLYAPGVGGDKQCAPDPERHRPVPCDGPRKDWDEHLQSMTDAERDEILRQAVNAKRSKQ